MQAAGERRIGRLADVLAARGASWLIVSVPANVRYLTGYTGSNGLAVIAASGGGGQHLFVTDFRYETQAQQEVGACAPSCERSIVTGELVEAAAKAIGERADERIETAGESLKVGFDERDLSVARHQKLEDALGESVSGRFELVACGGMVESLREVKEEAELALIAAACELADEALLTVLEDGLIGRGEREIAIALEARMRMLGASAPSFPTIVASGEHGALPHAQPRDVQVTAGTLVTIDWGCVLDGYCSDCTRTYAAGEVNGRAREVYELVLAAQQAGLDALRQGMSGKQVDEIAREVIEQAGFGERFGHGLGHGVGIEVHEGPRLSKTASDQPLLQGNVVSVEPGIYLPGELGVRIEDLAVVGVGQARVLTPLPKELAVIS